MHLNHELSTIHIDTCPNRVIDMALYFAFRTMRHVFNIYLYVFLTCC